MKLCFILAALLLATSPGAWSAEAAGFCKSMCGSERQECRAAARNASGVGDRFESGQQEKNPLAYTAGRLQGQSEPARAADRADFQKRQSERDGVCEDKYQRCSRACALPAEPARGA